MADKTIEGFIADHPDWRGEVMKALDALIRETAPGVEGAIKWAQPVYSKSGPMIFFRPAAKHVTIGFWRGTELLDPQGLLDGEGDRMKHLKIKSPTIPREQLEAWIREAVRLNAEKGDPTKGMKKKKE